MYRNDSLFFRHIQNGTIGKIVTMVIFTKYFQIWDKIIFNE